MIHTWFFYFVRTIFFFLTNCFYFILFLPLSLKKFMIVCFVLVCSNEKVATLSVEAIMKIAGSPGGIVWF